MERDPGQGTDNIPERVASRFLLRQMMAVTTTTTSSTSALARLHRLALLLLAIYLNVVSSQGSSCQLPDAWRGTWFQSGLNTVRINETTIDFKGKCLESDGEYYLFEEKLEKEEKCYRCLFIAQKHPNVLQYKESYCEGRDTLENLCSMIPGDAQQYSLFRRDAAPVECPFRGSYTFTYSRGHGECRSPVSRLDSCTESWRTFFRYQACPDVQGTESSEEQLECLAQWKDGSLRYLMGRLQHQGATSDEDRYRCFVYEKIQPPPSSLSPSSLLLPGGSSATPTERHRPVTILLAQSGDATCSGLTSPTEGSRTLKLTKAEADGRKCHYPGWFLAHNRWQTLDGRWTYTLHKNSTMRIINNTTSGHGTVTSAIVGGLSFGAGSASVDSRMEQKAACQSVLELGDGAARVVAHLSQGCQSGYVCMVFYRRDSHVVEFQAGEAAPAPDEACSAYYFNPVVGHLTTLIAASHHSVACPLDGKFNVMRTLSHASSRLPCSSDSMANDVTSAVATPHLFLAGQRTSAVAVGCSAPDTLDLYHECSRETSSGYLCRSTWNDDHDERIKYVIVTPLHAAANRHGVDGPPRRFCLTVTTHGSKASTLTPSDNQPQHPQDHHVSSVSNNGANGAPLEWIASSETCVRTYARDRLATHGQHSTHLSHNAHNLHITTADGDGNSAGASVFNVTSAGQCTGVEAAILDQRKLFPSSSSSSSTSATAALLSPSTMDYVLLLLMVVGAGRLVGR